MIQLIIIEVWLKLLLEIIMVQSQIIIKPLKLLENTSFGEHGFDLANPKLIEEAINDGRIKSFEREHQISDKTKDL